MLIIMREGVFLVIGVIFLYLLLEKKFSRKITLFFLIPCVTIVFLFNAIFILGKNPDIFIHAYPFTVVLPVSLPFIVLSRHRGFKMLFNILTALFLGIIIRICGFYFSALFSYSEASSMIGQILAFPVVLFFLLKKMRPPYLEILNQLKKGWANFCLVPLFSHVLIYFLFNHQAFSGSLLKSYIPIVVAISFTIFFYMIMISFFKQIQFQFSMQNEQNLLRTHVAALQKQLNLAKDTQEKMQILRHDSRHHSQALASLIGSGDTDKALAYISQFNASLDDTRVPVYCENPTINAVLSYYIENARKEGITVRTRLDIPLKIPVDEMELSAVFANAVENARNACLKMPPGANPLIELVCVNKQHFVFECSNTFAGKINFDQNGFPYSRMDAHGTGTKSIAAFAKKHNALLDYQIDGSILRFRLTVAAAAFHQ